MSTVITIDRSIPFDAITFLGKGWSIVEQDERALALSKVDLSQVTLMEPEDVFEAQITGEEYLNILKRFGALRLDAKVLQTLWENKHLIPEIWKQTRLNWKAICADGTVLLDPNGRRCVLCMYWHSFESKWILNDHPLEYRRSFSCEEYPSVLLVD